MEQNLPATRPDTAVVIHEEPDVERPRQDVGVGLMPLALATFVVLAFVAAAWTFLATAGV